MAFMAYRNERFYPIGVFPAAGFVVYLGSFYRAALFSYPATGIFRKKHFAELRVDFLDFLTRGR
jgi:hypothetical protein